MQKAALAFGDANPIALTEQAILDAARHQTGLHDFGADDFRERLNILLDEWNGDPAMTQIWRLTLLGYATRYAANRLLIHDTLQRHPEIHDEQIDRPIIIAGLPRSGTTHLVNLIAADTRLQALPLWESYEPVPLPGEGLLPDGTDPRYQRCADAWERSQQISPVIAAMHPMNPDHIHEELELMGPDFASYNFEWIGRVPGWRDHYYATDQTPHYEYMKTVLKLLQWRNGKKRWVLKCPQHLEQLGVLKSVFPDAVVAITHRDPVAVIQSAVTMQAYSARMQRTEVDAPWLIAYWTDRVEHLLRACVADRAVWPADQSIDVPFHEFMADDVAMVGKIFARAQLPMTDRAHAEIAAHMAAHQRGKEGRMVYNLERDFGVKPDVLRERFRFYFDAFPVKAEVH
ncbi:sulfotransferase [Caenibius tardaugens NBRC 16725]|nr:sulfotransferase [Caenibius tardaugens NBRC 16725]